VIALFPEASATPRTLQPVVPEAIPESPVAPFVHVTTVTPTASEAVPPRDAGEEDAAYVADDVGNVMAHTGAVTSYVTVIVSAPTFPAASRARAVIALSPTASAIPGTFQLVVPLPAPEDPVAAFVQLTCVTPMLSEELPPRSTVPDEAAYVAPDVGNVIVHVGDAPSYVTVRTSVPTFPAASLARTVMTLFPAARAIPTTFQAVVPEAPPDAPVAAFVHVTAVTPIPSEAVPPRFTMEEEVPQVAEAVGEVIVHDGAVGS
jgi:hypothetical protein